MTSYESKEVPATRVGTIVWGLLIVALAALIIVSQLGVISLNGSYVAIGLMIGAGLALVIGGIVSGASKKSRGAAATTQSDNSSTNTEA